jgi:hypothetical protein
MAPTITKSPKMATLTITLFPLTIEAYTTILPVQFQDGSNTIDVPKFQIVPSSANGYKSNNKIFAWLLLVKC